MFSKITKLLFLLILITVLSISGIALHQFQSVEAQGVEYDLAGWLWSETYGWISLNSDNTAGPVEYGVIIDSSDQISGYGWSENVGWICFGSSCGNSIDCVGSVPDPAGTLSASLDTETGQITGWAKVCSLGDDGKIHLHREVGIGSGNGEDCYDCEPACDLLTEYCDEEGVCSLSLPCIRYSETEFDSCKTCFANTNFDGVNIPYSDEKSIVGGSGYICMDCGNAGNTCRKIPSASGVEGEYRIACHEDANNNDSCFSCEMYGVAGDSKSGDLVGWAWGGFKKDGAKGIGWVHFNPLEGNAFIVYPWLETKYGAIYAPEKVMQKARSVGNNASYCIFADSIRHISSENCLNVVKGVEIDFPSLWGANPVYRNALGKIDVNGLIAVNEIIGGKGYNKYGHEVVEISIPSALNNRALNNMVFFTDKNNIYSGNLTVNSDLTFLNGDTGERGNGTVIVNGDLIINNNVFYSASDLSDLKQLDLKQLASVAWIVKGDVIINAEFVQKVSGAFVLLGNGESCIGSGDEYPTYDQNGCGVFFSGTKASGRDDSLAVYGLVVAKAFDLRRNFTDALIGSERIIYDGRLIANPPPGLKGFSEGLPIIRDTTF